MATRKDIRSAIVTMLVGNTSAGSSVYANRDTPLWEAELPAILVSATQEAVEPKSLSGNKNIRTLDLEINIKAQADQSLDDTLDDLGAEVEAILGADRTIQGTSFSTVLTGTSISLDTEGETPTGTLTLSYQIKYLD